MDVKKTPKITKIMKDTLLKHLRKDWNLEMKKAVLSQITRGALTFKVLNNLQILEISYCK